MNFKFYFIPELGHYFLEGVLVTLELAVASIICGTILGLVFALMRMSRVKPLRWLSNAYTTFIRGVPILVLVYIVYYSINWDLPPFFAATIALSVSSSAYIAEIIRSGIQSVDKGQMEAARSLGISHFSAMRYIIIPQAIKNILPALGNQLIIAVKDTSIVSVLGLGELTYNTDTIRSLTYLSFEPLIICAIMYFVLTWALKKGVDAMERRMQRSV